MFQRVSLVFSSFFFSLSCAYPCIHFSTTCLSNSRKMRRIHEKLFIGCGMWAVNRRVRKVMLLLLLLFCYFSCYNHRLTLITVTFLFLPFFSRSLFSWCIFSFIRNPNQIYSPKKNGYIYSYYDENSENCSEMLHSTLSAVCEFRSLSLFASFFFFTSVIIYRTCYVFVGIHFLIHKRASAELYWNSGGAAHWKKKIWNECVCWWWLCCCCC